MYTSAGQHEGMGCGLRWGLKLRCSPYYMSPAARRHVSYVMSEGGAESWSARGGQERIWHILGAGEWDRKRNAEEQG